MSETKLVRAIQMLSQGPVRLFRNNCGKLQDKNGTWVAYGLCPGSSDLIGWKTVIVTPQMVGLPVALFTALEVKMPRRNATEEQADFLLTVHSAGGVAAVVRSLDAACQVLNIDDKGNTFRV